MKGVPDTPLAAQKKMPGVSWEQLERQPLGIARGISQGSQPEFG